MESFKRQPTDILELFDTKPYLKICAPMVRYSKLQFRTLVRGYGTDLCYTPMILADSFCQSAKARSNEFTTSLSDTPLIAQFAANTVHDFVGAAHLIAPYCDGVGLNCGCPQRWAKQQGLGCIMLENPDLISAIVKECRNAIPKPFTVSVKMRILKDLRKTVEVCRQLEKAGVSFLSVHARTSSQLTGDINVEALKLITENVGCPVVANGGVKSVEECDRLHKETNCRGVMVANAILNNPTLFSGSNETTTGCIQNWLDICYNSTIDLRDAATPRVPMIGDKPSNLTFQCFHHHLVFMLEKVLPRAKRKIFNNLQKFGEVLRFLDDELCLIPKIFECEAFLRNTVVELDYEGREVLYSDLKERNCGYVTGSKSYCCNDSDGNYFRSKTDIVDDDDCDLNGIFIEDG